MTDQKKRAVTSRKNGAKSRGPVTGEGKARSSQNAVAHGLAAQSPVIPGEDPGGWEAHRAGVAASLAPQGRLEEELADRVALLLWRLRRVSAYETGQLAANVEDATDGPPPAPVSQPVAWLQAHRAVVGDAGDRTHQALESARNTLAAFRPQHELYQRLDSLPPDAPIDGEAAAGLINEAGDELPGDNGCECLDFTNSEEFREALGVPDDVALHLWAGWTPAKLREAIGLIASEYGDDPARLLAAAGASAAATVAHQESEVARHEEAQRRQQAARQEEIQRCERERQRQGQRKASAACMLDAASLDRIQRYESHLSRQLAFALHTLERLQAARAGQDVPVPAALDVAVDS